MGKRIIVYLMACLLVVSLIAGCGLPDQNGAATAATATTAAAAAATTAAATEATTAAAVAATTAAAAATTQQAAAGQTGADKSDWPSVEISFWEVGDIYSFQPENDDPYAEILQEKAQINIVNRPITSSDYTEKIPLWAATDDLPNVFIYPGPNNNTIWPWQEQGLIHSIPEDLSAYPILDKYLHEDAIALYRQVMKDGVYWAIPRADFVVPMTYTHGIPYMYISDYEALGSPPIPESIDEWFDFCTSIQKTFPDRNVISSRYDQVSNLFGEFNPALSNDPWFYYEDKGLWGPPFFNNYDQYKEANRFWKAGFIDKDMLTNTVDATIFRDRFIEAESVIYINTPFPGHMSNEFQPYWDKKHPTESIGATLMQLHRPADYSGNHYVAPLKYWSENYISSKTNDDQLAAIFRLYEFCLSDEGFEFRRFGIKGVDYEKSGDEITITREKSSTGVFKPLAEIYPSGYFAKCWATWDEEFPFVDPAIDPGIHAFGQNYLEFKKTFKPQPETYNLLMTTISTEKKIELVFNSGGEDILRLISADDYDAEHSAMMAKYESMGLWEMCAEINDIGRELGYID